MADRGRLAFQPPPSSPTAESLLPTREDEGWGRGFLRAIVEGLGMGPGPSPMGMAVGLPAGWTRLYRVQAPSGISRLWGDTPFSQFQQTVHPNLPDLGAGTRFFTSNPVFARLYRSLAGGPPGERVYTKIDLPKALAEQYRLDQFPGPHHGAVPEIEYVIPPWLGPLIERVNRAAPSVGP